VIVVTNEAAVARGLMTENGVEKIHPHLRRLLRQVAGARIDKIYYCAFHRDGTVPRCARPSNRRKPNPGMLLDAARDLGINLQHSCLVGDKESDMIAAKHGGCKAIAVLTGPDATEVESWSVGGPDFVAGDLPEAVRWILNERCRRSMAREARPCDEGAAGSCRRRGAGLGNLGWTKA
jgi:D-glycero-D-manno-heptose 1,7-bisphosphate phosphatase